MTTLKDIALVLSFIFMFAALGAGSLLLAAVTGG